MSKPTDYRMIGFQADGASVRQRKKSDTLPFPDLRRKSSIKDGIDELQRILPHLGTPETEKVGSGNDPDLAGPSKSHSLERWTEKQLSLNHGVCKDVPLRVEWPIKLFYNPALLT